MRKAFKFIWLFVKHWYTFAILLLIDPYDVSDKVFRMNYTPPQWLFWFLLVLATGIALLLTIRDWRKISRNNPIVWDIYDKLRNYFESLKWANTDKERDIIFKDIREQRGKLPDKKLDKIISLYLNAENEAYELNMSRIDGNSQSMLDGLNEKLRNYIVNKYGERVYGEARETKV